MWALQRHFGVSMLKTLKSLVPPVLATAVMAAVVLLLHASLRQQIASPILSLAVLVSIAVIAYGVALLVFGGRQMRDQLFQIKTFLRKRPAAT
jgi:glucan phosphoethanolaminetransferase (alkaline phosphatase superfamily)